MQTDQEFDVWKICLLIAFRNHTYIVSFIFPQFLQDILDALFSMFSIENGNNVPRKLVFQALVSTNSYVDYLLWTDHSQFLKLYLFYNIIH